MTRIVLCYPVEERHLAQIRSTMPEAQVVNAGQQRIPEEILSADIFCGHAKERPIPWDDVVAKGQLKWIQSSAAGLDHCLVPSVVQSKIVVTSASGVLANQVAEQTLALTLGLLRSLPTFFRAQQRREFIRRPTMDLHHATIGIIGFGGNGRRLAEVLAPFEPRILVTDYFPQWKPPYVEAILPAGQWQELLPQVDILILAAPLTDQTRGMLDLASFRRMKRTALLINVARGPIVMEADLITALRENLIAGAGLDVTENEPLSPDSPLWELPNVIITPHVGGQSASRIDDMTRFFCGNLARWSQGQPLMNLVDKELGFPPPNCGNSQE